ncbi:hypothetical protein BV22DRAFT_1047605 [Leucogyrophana mollusca]|uniref:Uncharacterized protein n=1 Tax=Leucogyrophana mollusca TaxID=85980 RepID=A0ACB8BH80_9AGAM|nr:hypothetical protein BV22DRAFT_1047605 [Leucogyrophana mollusca]
MSTLELSLRDVKVVILTGIKEERAEIMASWLIPKEFDVYTRSVSSKNPRLRNFIRNVDSFLARIVREFMSCGQLLITATPLQNNLKELFALLHFICPEIFLDYADLDSFLHKGDDKANSEEDKSMKAADVEKNLLPRLTRKEGKTRLMNMVVQLRKSHVIHTFFDGAIIHNSQQEPGPPHTTDGHFIENSGKMLILNKLPQSMKAKDSCFLIFSQMSRVTRVLDIIEDYCLFRIFILLDINVPTEYCIDGSTACDNRIVAIDEYNKPDSERFIFLLTTRTLGLGISLTTADLVILASLISNFKPRAAHTVSVRRSRCTYSGSSRDVKERMLELGAQKPRLDQLVIQQGRQQTSKVASKDELLEMITADTENIINSPGDEADTEAQEQVRRPQSRRSQQLRDGQFYLSLSKRERKTNYSENNYFKTEKAPKVPRALKQIQIQDFQFFDLRSPSHRSENCLYIRFISYCLSSNLANVIRQRLNDIAATVREYQDPEGTPEKLEAERAPAQDFHGWSRRDFQQFVHALESCGWMDDYDLLASEIQGKDGKRVKKYYLYFKKRWKELSGASYCGSYRRRRSQA